VGASRLRVNIFACQFFSCEVLQLVTVRVVAALSLAVDGLPVIISPNIYRKILQSFYVFVVPSGSHVEFVLLPFVLSGCACGRKLENC
jgi:hypothetical protein